MYSSFFHLRENPFGETPNTKFFYKSLVHTSALQEIVRNISQGKGFTLLTGEVGTGKTILSRMLLKFLQDRAQTALVFNPLLSGHELLQAIGDELKIPQAAQAHQSPSSMSAQLARLSEFLIENAKMNRRVVVVIDEAQRLSPENLETVRLLSNLETEKQKLLQVVLIGQPELAVRLQQHDLRQLNQRISTKIVLPPLGLEDTEMYVRHRIEIAGGSNFLRFEDKAFRLLFEKTKGLPRLLNSFCERVIARAEGEQMRLIGSKLIRKIASHEISYHFESRQSLRRKWIRFFRKEKMVEM